MHKPPGILILMFMKKLAGAIALALWLSLGRRRLHGHPVKPIRAVLSNQ
jgi:hypothetical protein